MGCRLPSPRRWRVRQVSAMCVHTCVWSTYQVPCSSPVRPLAVARLVLKARALLDAFLCYIALDGSAQAQGSA
ncbi:hypothetical protein BD310DRAFT_930911, partial [Dichomitus squalens]